MDALAEKVGSSLTNGAWLVRKITSIFDQGGDIVKEAIDANRLGSTAYITAGIKHQWGNYYSQGGLLLAEIADTLNEGKSEEALDLLRMMNSLFGSLKHLTDMESAGRWDSAPEKQLLSEAIGRAKVLLAVIARRNDMRLEVKSGHDATVMIDQFQFEQVIINLYRNAEQALLRDVGNARDITISTHAVLSGDKEIFSELNERPYVCVSVKNGGLGMTPETFARIGTPEFTTKPKGEGSGLGLSVCAYLVEQHGGILIARTHAELGAMFTMCLPQDIK